MFNVMSAELIEDIRSDWKTAIEDKTVCLQFADTMRLMTWWCKRLVLGAFTCTRYNRIYAVVYRLPTKSANRFVFGCGREEVLNNFRKCLPLCLPRHTHTERFDSLLEWVAAETTNIINDHYLLPHLYLYWPVPCRIMRVGASLLNMAMLGDYRPEFRFAGDGHQIIAIPGNTRCFLGDAEKHEDDVF